MKGMPRTTAVGIPKHLHSAMLVTVAANGELQDRRRLDLTDGGLLAHLHNYEGSWTMSGYCQDEHE